MNTADPNTKKASGSRINRNDNQPEGGSVKFKIKNYEIGETKTVEAPGFLEAMLEYLPWPTLQLTCDYKPHHGKTRFIDERTGFTYDVEIANK